MNSALKKIFVADIDKQYIKGAKVIVMGYANRAFVKMVRWLYVRCFQITPGHHMRNQEDIEGTYNVKDPINIFFDQIDMVQELSVAGNVPFSNWKLADTGVEKILETQEYTHVYCIWKSIAADNRT